jgi:hypothetical protein
MDSVYISENAINSCHSTKIKKTIVPIQSAAPTWLLVFDMEGPDLSTQSHMQGARAGVHEDAFRAPVAPVVNLDRVVLPSGVRDGPSCLVDEEDLSRAGFDDSARAIEVDNGIVTFAGKGQELLHGLCDHFIAGGGCLSG